MNGHPGWNSGDVIAVSRSVAPPTQSPAPPSPPIEFIVDMKGKASFSLAYKEKPYHRINITASGDIEVRNCVGKHSFFLLEKDDATTCCYRIKSASKIKQKSNKDEKPQDNGRCEEYYYLALSTLNNKVEVIAESMMLHAHQHDSSSGCGTNHPHSCTSFNIHVVRDFSYSNISSKPAKTMSTPKVLKKWDKQRFKREGFLHLSNVILPSKVFECTHLLMRSLGVPGSISAGGTQDGLGKLGGYLSNCEEVRALLLHPETCKGSNVSLLNIIEELLGEGMVDLTSISGQIALRFPEYIKDSLVCSTTSSFLQLPDGSLPIGSAWHTDGLRQGKFHGFSVLVGVCLSDCLEDFAGNLLVWPGSHVPIHHTLIGVHGGLDLELLAGLVQGENDEHEDQDQDEGVNGGLKHVSIAPLDSSCADSDTVRPETRHTHANTNSTNNLTDTNTNTDITYTAMHSSPNTDIVTSSPTDTSHSDPIPLHDNAPVNLPSLGHPLQLHLRAGDVVLVHPDTAHCGGPNFSCVIRNMLYFRIKRCQIREGDELYRDDMWADMPGLC